MVSKIFSTILVFIGTLLFFRFFLYAPITAFVIIVVSLVCIFLVVRARLQKDRLESESSNSLSNGATYVDTYYDMQRIQQQHADDVSRAYSKYRSDLEKIKQPYDRQP